VNILVFLIHNTLVVDIFEVRWKPETVKSRSSWLTYLPSTFYYGN
ncbi:uncharacterized protein METZ01_LOCUS157765, partial [marine metagenome]